MPAPKAVAMTGADQVICDRPAMYHGFTIRETGGSAAAVVVIYDHPFAALGTPLEEISLAAGGSAREMYGPGIQATNGVYVDVVSGAVAGSIRIG